MSAFLFFFLGFIIGAGLIFFWLDKNQKKSLQTKIEKEQIEKERETLLSENQDYRQKEIDWIEQSASLKSRNKNIEKELENQKKHYEDKIQEKEEHFKQLEKKAEKERENQKNRYEDKIQEKEEHFKQLEKKAEKERENQKNYYEDKIQEREGHFKQLEEKAKGFFKNTANEIFSESTEKSTKNLSQILKPFKEDIEGFKKSIQGFEIKEKSLDETLKNFTDINSKMRDDTIKLTQALRGDARTQGQWGEFVLENILEKSGLRKGEEFIIQGQGLGIKDEKGSFVKPDIIVKLPDNKHIIIDSKVSLTHYTSLNGQKKQDSLVEKTVRSLSSHIDNLSSKKYQLSEGLNTPDFVLMFIPNEGVFALATQAQRDLFEKAWKQSIVIVSPSTLYATLRTIASLWKIERQNKNVEEIAKQGGLLYDKFVGFLEDMGKIDTSLKTARISYDSAVKKLDEGKGSLVKKVQNLKKLGARTQKTIPASFESE